MEEIARLIDRDQSALTGLVDKLGFSGYLELEIGDWVDFAVR